MNRARHIRRTRDTEHSGEAHRAERDDCVERVARHQGARYRPLVGRPPRAPKPYTSLDALPPKVEEFAIRPKDDMEAFGLVLYAP